MFRIKQIDTEMGKVVQMAKRLSGKEERKGRLRAIRTRIPGGASITRYFKRKPGKARKVQSKKARK
jgi:hypothetical protein